MKSYFLPLAVITLIICSAAAIIWTWKSMEGQVSRRVAGSQETVLNTTQQALRIWQEQTLTNALITANSTEIRDAVEKQLAVPREFRSLSRSQPLHELRQRLSAYITQHNYLDFDVISPEGTQVASGLNDLLGQNVLGNLNRDFLDAILTGGSKIAQPIAVPGTPRKAISRNMAVGVPILNEENAVIAALIFRFDPAKEFTPLMTIGRLGRTGDIYMFDRHANLLTPTRFQSLPGSELRDPGGDTTEGFRPRQPPEQRPLTHMALAATEGKSGIDLDGYRDYRGVQVVGTWLWDTDLEIGLASEMELTEAYAPVRTIRALSIVMISVVTMTVLLLMRVARHRERLQVTNYGYQEALKARQDLLGIVAHDLKNPINSVALSSSVLAKMLQTSQPDIGFAVQSLGVIHRSAFRMNRLIEDLLTSTRIEAGQFRIRPQQCDVQALLHEFEQVVFPLLSEKSIELVCTSSSDLPQAFADADRIMQILSNLVGNAIKYTPPQGVVTVKAIASDNEIEFSVKDTGPGIPESELPQIFNQYWQGQHSRGGSGLGLYISKAFVEAHGGRIWFESIVGEGTTVFFTIPRAVEVKATLPETLAC